MPWSASTPASSADSPTGPLRVVEPEVPDREGRAAERSVAAARPPVAGALRPFGLAAPPAINEELMRQRWQARASRLDGGEPLDHLPVAQTHVAAYGALAARGRAQ